MPAATQKRDGSALAAAVLEPAARRLLASSYLYFELELSMTGYVTAQVRHHPPKDAALAGYGEHIFSTDPLTLPFRSWLYAGETQGRGPSVVALGELPHAARAEYERRFLHRADIYDVIGLGVPAVIGGRTKVLCFGFHRRATDPSFGSNERRALERLADSLRLKAENLALHDSALR